MKPAEDTPLSALALAKLAETVIYVQMGVDLVLQRTWSASFILITLALLVVARFVAVFSVPIFCVACVVVIEITIVIIVIRIRVISIYLIQSTVIIRGKGRVS